MPSHWDHLWRAGRPLNGGFLGLFQAPWAAVANPDRNTRLKVAAGSTRHKERIRLLFEKGPDRSLLFHTRFAGRGAMLGDRY